MAKRDRSLPGVDLGNARVLGVELDALARSMLNPNTRQWEVVVPSWTPPSLNKLLRMHWATRYRMGRVINRRIALACLVAKVPPATVKRRVSITLGYARKCRALDEDNAVKLLLDALVKAGALVDDSPEWLERGPYAVRFDGQATYLEIEDVEPREGRDA